MNDQQPESPKPREPRTHWINPAIPFEFDDPVPSKRGRTRERVRRRREAKPTDLKATFQTSIKGATLPTLKTHWTWFVIGIAALSILIVIGLVIFAPARSQGGVQVTAGANLFNPPATGVPTVAPQLNVRAWDAQKRFTVLVMGIDKRPGETGIGFRTDTLILVSIDPANKSIGMLSIPRDLWVPFPDSPDLQMINTAYVTGELKEPGSGPILAMQAVQYNFGMPVSNFVVVSFDTVIQLVDAVGGVDIDVPTEIDDPEYPDMNFGYDPLHIPAGHIHMDGQLALKYARTRHQTDDFDRTRRQQQVIIAIRQKALQASTLTQLIGQAPDLWNKLSKGIITNVTFDQWASLGWYAKDIPAENIHRGTIDQQYIQEVSYQGNMVMTPDRSKIQEFMTQIFGPDYTH